MSALRHGIDPRALRAEDVARRLADERIAPRAAQVDRDGKMPLDTIAALAEHGLMGVNVPAAYGGMEATTVGYSLAMQQIAKADASVSVTMAVTNMVGEILCRFGTDAQKARFVPRLTGGAAVAGSFALSEAGSGTDAASLRTTAVRRGDHYVLNGSKMWITSGDVAGVIIVYARTDASHKQRGISAFIVEPSYPGFFVGSHEQKTGLHGSTTVGLTFEDCLVPAENLLAGEGQGFTIAMAALDGGRIGIASQAVGIATGALEVAVRYAAGREQFGRPIADHGMVQERIADMATRLDASRLLVLRAAGLKDQGRRYTLEASMAKLFATEAALRICEDALQIHGGVGYTRDVPVERMLRDVRVCSIYEGTSEVQRIVIAREVLRGLTH